MPINPTRKVIFIHIPKTAGTSIYELLGIQKNKTHMYSGAQLVPCLQHLTPIQLRSKIPATLWNQSYKFTVVRNPFDRLVSDYRYLRDKLPQHKYTKSFEAFVGLAKNIVQSKKYRENVYFDHFRPQVEYMSGITYNKICRFENLEKDIQDVLTKVLGTQRRAPLPWIHKTSAIHGPANYRFYYNANTKTIVESLYAEDLRRFNYTF